MDALPQALSILRWWWNCLIYLLGQLLPTFTELLQLVLYQPLLLRQLLVHHFKGATFSFYKAFSAPQEILLRSQRSLPLIEVQFCRREGGLWALSQGEELVGLAAESTLLSQESLPALDLREVSRRASLLLGFGRFE